MSNVISFRPKTPSPAKPESVDIAPDRRYWLEDIHMAATCAALVDHDQEALDMLMQVKHTMLSEGRALTRVSKEVRTRCAKYLGGTSKEREERIKSVVSAIYSN